MFMGIDVCRGFWRALFCFVLFAISKQVFAKGGSQAFRLVLPGSYSQGISSTLYSHCFAYIDRKFSSERRDFKIYLDRLDVEKNRRLVILNYSFWIAHTEVTQSEFKKYFGGDYSSAYRCGSKCPAEFMNWNDAARFTNLYSRAHGLPGCFVCRKTRWSWSCRARSHKNYLKCRGYRLPTEAEWEYAARLDLGHIEKKITHIQKAYRFFSPYAWHGKNSDDPNATLPCIDRPTEKTTCGPRAVGTKRAGRIGLFDIIGNVSEWCYDRYERYKDARVVNPIGPRIGAYRVVRGSSFYSLPHELRLSRRRPKRPILRTSRLGFRMARTHFPDEAKHPTSRPTSRPASRPAKHR